MMPRPTITFQFRPAVSPRYIESLLLKISYETWYSTTQLAAILRSQDLVLDGMDIVNDNTSAWFLLGLGQIKKQSIDKKTQNMFRLTGLGKQLIELYSTNTEQFFDVMHFLLYSVLLRSNDPGRYRFWLYKNVCDNLWHSAPSIIDTSTLTNLLQIEGHLAFPDQEPSFNNKSVQAVYSWLQVLTPPFLAKTNKGQMRSNRRKYCTPQLFHLATDLIYIKQEQLQYGTSLSVTERQIESICKACLLDPTSFWEMADLARMSISGFEIRKGQWGTSIALEGPPTRITLPAFSIEKPLEDIKGLEVAGEA